MYNRGYRLCGYPKKDTVGVNATTGLIAVTADTDVYSILKQQEIDDGKIQVSDSFVIKDFAIKVDSQCWVEFEDGSQVGIHPDDGFLTFDKKSVIGLTFRNDTNFKIAYSY